MGVVYHSNYLVWFEMGRTELMREAGATYAELEDRQQLFFPVIEAQVRYLSPARYDDLLHVLTRVDSIGRARVRFAYEVRKQGSDDLLATGSTAHAAVNENTRPIRLPDEIRHRLAGYTGST